MKRKLNNMEKEVLKNPVVLAFTTIIEMAAKLALPIQVELRKNTGDIRVKIEFARMVTPEKTHGGKRASK